MSEQTQDLTITEETTHIDVDAGREKNPRKAEVMAYAGKALTEEAMSLVELAEDAAIEDNLNGANILLSEANKTIMKADRRMDSAGEIYEAGREIISHK